MAKFPFTNFFDRNSNGQMDFTEELLAMKVFEDALPGEVVSIQKHRRDTALYPVDRAKFVVGKVCGISSN